MRIRLTYNEPESSIRPKIEESPEGDVKNLYATRFKWMVAAFASLS
jgi:hypothetical protein